MKISSSTFFAAVLTASSVFVPSTATPVPVDREVISSVLSKVTALMGQTAQALSDKCTLATAVPLGTGTEYLPGPTGNLKAVVMGFGTQNYKCTAEGEAPTPYGADATLFDTRCLANSQMGQASLEEIAKAYLGSSMRGGRIAPAALNNFQIGTHFFIEGKTPVFELKGNKKGKFVGKKLGNVPAPGNAIQDTNGAVDWLKLGRAYENDAPEPKLKSESYTQVYRVHTAGGKPPKKCPAPTNRGSADYTITIPYVTQYWLYV